jgi:hypothetical protein
MRLLCPFCQKPISVPDSEAGKAVNCPECGQQFAAPQLYSHSPGAQPVSSHAESRPGSAAPPVVPETYVPETRATDLPASSPDLSAYQKIRSVSFDPRVLRWVPPAALTLVFLLTFFPWNGMYPAGYPAYTQSAWQCMSAGLSWDEVAEAEMKLAEDLQKRAQTNWWLIPYLLLLFPALALAWAGPIVELAKVKLPEQVERFWEYRWAALTALLAVMFLFLLVQWASGFSLQRAIHEKIEADYAVTKETAQTPEKRQVYAMTVDRAAGAYRIKTTPWLRLAVLSHLVALLAAGALLLLALRGHKPTPRVAALW